MTVASTRSCPFASESNLQGRSAIFLIRVERQTLALAYQDPKGPYRSSRRIVTSVVVKAASSCRFAHELPAGAFPAWKSVPSPGGCSESDMVYDEHEKERHEMK